MKCGQKNLHTIFYHHQYTKLTFSEVMQKLEGTKTIVQEENCWKSSEVVKNYLQKKELKPDFEFFYC